MISLKFLGDLRSIFLIWKTSDKEQDPDASATSQVQMQSAKPSFNCEICHLKFRTKYQLTKHLKVHSGACHVKCPFCPKTLSRRDNALRHMKDTLTFQKKTGGRCLKFEDTLKEVEKLQLEMKTANNNIDWYIEVRQQAEIIRQVQAQRDAEIRGKGEDARIHWRQLGKAQEVIDRLEGLDNSKLRECVAQNLHETNKRTRASNLQTIRRRKASGLTHLWKTRRAHFRSGVNKTSLNDIERSAFVVILNDEDMHYDPEDSSKLDHWTHNLLHGKAHDRWFDKSPNLIISKNGHVGINTEHSCENQQ